MRRILSLAILIITLAFSLAAAPNPDEKADRQRWFQEMRQHQNDFVARELKLTDKQRADFLPLYNEMRDEIEAIGRASRAKAKEIKDKGAAVTDADYDAATQAYLDGRAKETEILAKYYKKFSHILSKEQLFRLDGAERKFDRMLMQHHPGNGNGGGKGPRGNGSRK